MQQHTYLNFEQRYKLEQKQDQKEKEELKIIQNTFAKQYPNLSFSDLQKQNDNYSTDDGCIHYKHKPTNKMFSWNYIENEWEDGHKLLNNLFD
jgi:hypothetical protein